MNHRESDRKIRTIGFIGGGRIVGIFLDAWRNTGGGLPGSIVVSDSSAEVLNRLKARHPSVETLFDNQAAAGCDYVFLALHPPAMGPELGAVKGGLKAGSVLVSLAPKWTMAQISAALGGFNRIVRMIPNAPSIVGEGSNPLAFSTALSKAERKEFLRLVKAFGSSRDVEEGKLEAYAILTAMGPTYLWFQLQKLRELGVSFSLTEQETDKALQAMIKGAAKTLFKSGLSYDAVVDLIPLKPIGAEEENIRQIYETNLTGLYRKLKG